MSKDRLEGLCELTALQMQTAQAALAEVTAREMGLRGQLQILVADRRAVAERTRQPDEPAFTAGADLRWHRWVDQRREVINAELARVLVLKEERLRGLRLAFGRDQASAEISKASARQRGVTQKRRASYES